MQTEIIDHVKFGIISPDEIRRISVEKLTIPDTYNEDGYPIDGGLLDQRLGVIDPGLICKTCGGRAKICPGHFGHVELIRPVVHSEFAKVIHILLQATCQKCHKLLLDEEHIAELREKMRNVVVLGEPEENKGSTVEERDSLLKKLKSVKKCPYCGTVQQRIKFETPTYFYIGETRIKPDEIRDMLAKISDDDLQVLGIDPETSRPEWLVLNALLVPPVNVRPSITLESGERSEDDLTHKLVDIMRINQRLEQNINAGAPQIIIDDLWELLQYNVTTYFNNETSGIPPARHRSGRALKTLAQRLKGKEGRFRYNLSGKRVNFSSRTVISVDPSIAVDEVGVPMPIASVLTVPFYVTEWNIEKAKVLLSRNEYPTVLNVIAKDGKRKRVADTNREELLKELSAGMVIERQLADGDMVLFNRQPSLHRISIMAHRVRVLPGRTFRINVCTTNPYNADFDGDEMNLHVPQTLESQAEAKYLMEVENQVFSPRNGAAIISSMHDDFTGMFILTLGETAVNKKEAAYMLSRAGVYELPKAMKGGMYDGRAIFSMLLPKDLSLDLQTKSGRVNISSGRLVEGQITKEAYNAILTSIAVKYGMTDLRKFIERAARAADAFVTLYGVTVGVKEYMIDKATDTERGAMLKNTLANVAELIAKYKSGKLEPLVGYTMRQSLEQMILFELNKAAKGAETLISKNVPKMNNALIIANVGGRGSVFNFVQMSMFLGQQATLGGTRIKRGYASGRVLPHLKARSVDPVDHGFIESSFRTGLSPVDMYMHAIGSRISESYKSLLTARSGYLQRRLINALQDYYVYEDNSVRDVHGNMIETIYGGDAIDPIKVKLAKSKE